jgi:short-subunit dehydrogenase
MHMSQPKLAVVTGASSGIGLELAKLAANDGFDLIVAADTPFVEAAPAFKEFDVGVEQIEADLSSQQGVQQLLEMIGDRQVDVLVANAGHGLGHGFLDQAPDEWQHVINTNITGTLLLIQPIVQRMVERGEGKVLITGSIAGHIAGTFQAVYNGSKAFVDSFAAALNEEIKGSGVTITCLKPGATDTNFFHRAEMDDTKVGQAKKDDPADVAKVGWKAMKSGEPAVIYGLKNKMQVAVSEVLPDAQTAKIHRKQAEPGSGLD